MHPAPRAPTSRPRLLPSVLAVGAVLASFCPTFAPRQALAGDVPETVVAGYEASAGCPDRARFVALLRSYLDPADVPDALPSFVVRFSTEPAPRGSLTMSTPGGPPAERTVDAATCDDAALALAYVAALAISPNARTGLGPPVTVPPATAAASTSVSSAEASSAEASSANAPTPPVASPARLTPVPAEPRWSVGAGVFAMSGLAPLLAPGVDLSGERRWGDLALGLDLAAATRAADPSGDGSARFTLLVARIFGCPWAARPTPRVELSPCLAFSAGRVAASASGLDRSTSSVQPWLVPAIRFRAGVSLGAGLGIALRGDLGAPLARPVYRFDEPALTVHAVPAVVGEVGLSVFRAFR